MQLGLLIGIGGGLASALLFYSAARGSPMLSTLLLLLTPLPTLLAGLGWGWLAATAMTMAPARAPAAAASHPQPRPASRVGKGVSSSRSVLSIGEPRAAE